MDYREVRVGDETIKYFDVGKGETILFLHGYGYKPHFYSDLIIELSKSYRVVAPMLGAINYLKKQPKTIDGYVRLTIDFIRELGLMDFHIVAHSMGCEVAFGYSMLAGDVRSIVAFAPAMPTRYGVFGFFWRMIFMYTREISGRLGETEEKQKAISYHSRSYLNEFVSNLFILPISNYLMLNQYSRYGFSELKVENPVLILMGELDEYYDKRISADDTLKEAFTDFRFTMLKDGNHNYIAFYPKDAARMIEEFHQEKLIE